MGLSLELKSCWVGLSYEAVSGCIEFCCWWACYQASGQAWILSHPWAEDTASSTLFCRVALEQGPASVSKDESSGGGPNLITRYSDECVSSQVPANVPG